MLYVSWSRCADDRPAHAVTDEDFASGVHARQGRYASVCGHELLIDSCLAPVSRVCEVCRALVVAHGRPSAPVHRAGRPRRPLQRCLAAFRRTRTTTR